jgi:CubicO group peptidase (beta-lactamase class C family)
MVRLTVFTMVALGLATIGVLSLPAETQVLAASEGAGQVRTEDVDRLFAKWNKPDSAGAVVAVIKNGAIIYSRGYGMANLEYGVPNTPATVYDLASVSKQFTALAIHLLAQEGKLSLDDDVRKYLPELHDFGPKITIGHLLHHTSGLRDQWNLFALAGLGLDDAVTEKDILGLIWQQRELNFDPGSQYLYSNTDYTLLALIVRCASGMSLPRFARERIFQPLGMTHTHFQDNYGTVVKDRAYSYEADDKGTYRYVALSIANPGPSSLFSTVGDLALWDRNFYTGQVGGKALIAAMEVPGRLNDGKEIGYASGLVIGTYRGLATVSHEGGAAGYRAIILRFPDEHFSVIILANVGDAYSALAYRVADIYLSGSFSSPPVARNDRVSAEIKVAPKTLDAVVGDYALAPDFIITFSREGDQLFAQATGQRRYPVFWSADNTVFWKVVDAHFTFDAPDGDGRVTGGVHHQNGRDKPAKKIGALTAEQIKDYSGDFYSAELRTIYTVAAVDGVVSVRYPRREIALKPSGPDTFAGAYPIGALTFSRAPDGSCDGFTIDDGRVQKLRFAKVTVAPVGRQP